MNFRKVPLLSPRKCPVGDNRIARSFQRLRRLYDWQDSGLFPLTIGVQGVAQDAQAVPAKVPLGGVSYAPPLIIPSATAASTHGMFAIVDRLEAIPGCSDGTVVSVHLNELEAHPMTFPNPSGAVRSREASPTRACKTRPFPEAKGKE